MKNKVKDFNTSGNITEYLKTKINTRMEILAVFQISELNFHIIFKYIFHMPNNTILSKLFFRIDVLCVYIASVRFFKTFLCYQLGLEYRVKLY